MMNSLRDWRDAPREMNRSECLSLNRYFGAYICQRIASLNVYIWSSKNSSRLFWWRWKVVLCAERKMKSQNEESVYIHIHIERDRVLWASRKSQARGEKRASPSDYRNVAHGGAVQEDGVCSLSHFAQERERERSTAPAARERNIPSRLYKIWCGKQTSYYMPHGHKK